MEDQAFKEILAKLGEAADVLAKLPPEVRLAAFQMIEKNIPGAHQDVSDKKKFFSIEINRRQTK